MKLCDDTKEDLIRIYNEKGVGLEGNILKILDTSDDKEFQEYVDECKKRDTETRKKRLEITKQIQSKNRELEKLNEENKSIMEQLQVSLKEVEDAKDKVMNDLDVLQKRKQTELIGSVVNIALGVIISIGIITTLMYIFALSIDKDTQIIGSTWSNMLGILLTNAFSIIATIMGVKYSNKTDKE